MRSTQIELLQSMPIFGAIRQDALQFLLDQARALGGDNPLLTEARGKL